MAYTIMARENKHSDITTQFNALITESQDKAIAKHIELQSEADLWNLFGIFSQPAFVVNTALGVVAAINDNLAEQLKFERNDIIGHSILDLGVWHSYESKKKALADTEDSYSKLTLKVKSGKLIAYRLQARNFNINGVRYLLCLLDRIAETEPVMQFVRTFENLLDYSRHGICVVKADKHIYVNERFSQMIGIPLDHIYATTPQDIITRIAHPDFIDIAKSSYNEFKPGDITSGNIELIIINPEKGERWFEIDANIIGDFDEPVVLMSLIDIDERKRAYEKIRSNERLFRTVMDSARDSIFIKDRQLRYIHVNAQMERLFNMSARELIGKTDDELFQPEDARHIKEVDSKVLDGEVIEEEHRKAISGKEIVFHVIKTPVKNKANEIVGICGIARDITRRIEDQDIIGKSEKKFRSIIESSQDIILTYQPDGTITYASPQTIKYGYNHEDLIGRKIFEFVHPDDLERVVSAFHKMLLYDTSNPTLFRIIAKDGKIYDFDEKSSVIRDGERIVEIIGVIRDITERKTAVDALKQSEAKYRRLVETMNEGLGAVDADGIINFVNNSICRILGYTQDELLDHHVFEFLDDESKKLMAAQLEKRKIGDLGSYEITWLTKSGDYVVTLMSAAPLVDLKGIYTGSFGIITDITDRKRAENALIKSEERYRQAVEKSPNPIFSVDRQGFIKTWNRACVEVFGYGPEIIGKYYELIISNETNHKLITAGINGVFQNQSLNDMDIELRTSSGETRYMVSRLYPLLNDQGEVELCVFANTDITDRKLAEIALKDSEERFRELAELAPEGIYEADKKGRVIFANRITLEKFGFTLEDLNTGINAIDIFAPEERERALENMKKMFAGGKTGANEYKVMRRDGTIFPISVHSSPVYRNGRVVGIRGIIVDITHRKRAEQALRESELFNRAVIEKSPLGVSVRSNTGKLLNCNDAWKRIWGKTDEQIRQYLNEPERDQLVFDRRDDYLGQWHEQIKKIYTEGGYFYIPEARLIYHKKGGNRWVSQHFYAITDMFGGVDKVVILTEDITERKRAAEKLQESAEYYRSLFESAHDAILVFDPEDETILDANQRACEIYGFTRDEFIGMSLKSISKDIPRGKEHISITVEKRFYHSFETVQYRKDGSEMTLEVNASLVRFGEREAILSLNRDITQKKKAEDALRASEERLRTIIDSAPISIFAFDKEGILTFYDGKKFENLIPVREGYLNRPLLEIFPHPDAPKLFQQALEGKLDLYHAEYSGRILEIRLSVRKDQNGEVVGLIGTTTDITDRVHAEDALKQREEMIRTIVTESTISLFAADRDSVITFVEGNLVGQLDLTKEELVGSAIFGKYIDQSYKYIFDKALAGELGSYVIEYQGKVLEARFSQQMSKSGKVIGLYGVVIDITRQKHIEQALREGEEKYRLLIETAGQPIFSVNRAGKFLTMNNTAAEYLGGVPSNFSGKTMWDLFPQQVADVQMANIREAIDHNKKIIMENPSILNGEEMWFITNIQPLKNSKGIADSALLIANDITLRKRLEIREKAKSQFLDDLRRIDSINECLELCCRTIRDAKIFKRSILTLHNDKREIVNFGQVGISDVEVDKALKSPAPDFELSQKLTDEKYRIRHSYYIPQANFSLASIRDRCIDQYEEQINDGCKWDSSDAFFVPLMNENDEPEGWLSADTPCSGHRPSYEDVIFIEELVDTTTKKVREIRYLELLETERMALREKNITLREVLAYIEEEKMEIKNQIAGEVQNSLMPIVKKLVNPDGKVNKTCYNILNQGLDSLVAPSSIKQIYSKLSPREIEICNLIKTNASSKDIAQELNISLATVQKHRESIRKKLKITNKNINLMTFLKG